MEILSLTTLRFLNLKFIIEILWFWIHLQYSWRIVPTKGMGRFIHLNTNQPTQLRISRIQLWMLSEFQYTNNFYPLEEKCWLETATLWGNLVWFINRCWSLNRWKFESRHFKAINSNWTLNRLILYKASRRESWKRRVFHWEIKSWCSLKIVSMIWTRHFWIVEFSTMTNWKSKNTWRSMSKMIQTMGAARGTYSIPTRLFPSAWLREWLQTKLAFPRATSCCHITIIWSMRIPWTQH